MEALTAQEKEILLISIDLIIEQGHDLIRNGCTKSESSLIVENNITLDGIKTKLRS